MDCKHKGGKKPNNEVIILSRMYAGKYLEDKIGHEIINLFTDDKGDHYIYINENGRINSEYNGRVQAVLFVRYVEKGVFEVIAKAEGLIQVLKKTVVEEESKSQIEFIRKNEIRYAGVFLDMVYPNSPSEKISISFKAQQVSLPIKPLYLIEDENKAGSYNNGVLLPKKHFSTQKLKMYYTTEKQPEDYKILDALIKRKRLWDNGDQVRKLDLMDYYDEHHGTSFISIIQKEYDELVFSNMFAYYFDQNRQVFERFASEVLGIEGLSKGFSVIRENKHHIDIWIEDEKNIIVIENKVKSKIHGERHDIYSEYNQSQLDEYYKKAKEESNGRNLYCYLFSPDYNNIDLSKYKARKHYSVINYSRIYKFYKMNAGDMLKIPYFSDFLDSLQIHSKSTDRSNFEIMRERFVRRIRMIRDNTIMD